MLLAEISSPVIIWIVFRESYNNNNNGARVFEFIHIQTRSEVSTVTDINEMYYRVGKIIRSNSDCARRAFLRKARARNAEEKRYTHRVETTEWYLRIRKTHQILTTDTISGRVVSARRWTQRCAERPLGGTGGEGKSSTRLRRRRFFSPRAHYTREHKWISILVEFATHDDNRS